MDTLITIPSIDRLSRTDELEMLDEWTRRARREREKALRAEARHGKGNTRPDARGTGSDGGR
jgi:hypothetical protein